MNLISMRAAPPAVVNRTFALEDITVRSGGDGRTVEAYAAVFDVEQTISDFEGDGYIELIRRGAFERTIAQRGARMQVIYNHGLDIYGNPAPEFSKPLGVTLEMREDARGLWTVTRYSNTPLADEVLTLIHDGAIRGQSFSGTWLRSNPQRGPYRRGQVVERTELAMREYGPTPFPAYADAAIVGVRSLSTLADELSGLSAEDRAELIRIIEGTPAADPAAPGTAETDPPDPGTPVALAGLADSPEVEFEMRKAQLLLG